MCVGKTLSLLGGVAVIIAIALLGAQEDKRQLHKKGTRTPAQDTEHASWTDDIGDVSHGFIDLYIGSLFAEDLTGDLEIAINVAGLHPVGTTVKTKFEMFFNTDNDSATGAGFGPFSGIDKILEISLRGQFPFTGAAGALTASLMDVRGHTSAPMPPGNVKRIQKIADRTTARSTSFSYSDSIRQLVPLGDLGLSAQQVPIGVRATNVDTAEFDEASFWFEIEGIVPK